MARLEVVKFEVENVSAYRVDIPSHQFSIFRATGQTFAVGRKPTKPDFFLVVFYDMNSLARKVVPLNKRRFEIRLNTFLTFWRLVVLGACVVGQQRQVFEVSVVILSSVVERALVLLQFDCLMQQCRESARRKHH